MKIHRTVLKWLLLSLGAILLAAIIGAGVCFYKYRTVERNNIPAEIVTAVHYELQDNTATMGTAFRAALTVKLPWNKRIGNVSVSEKQGVQKLSEPQISHAKMRFGYCLWDVSLPLQTYKTFDALEEPASLSIPCNARGNTETLSVTLPTLKSVYTPEHPDATPIAAPTLTKRTEKMNRRTIILMIAAGVVLIAAVAGIAIRLHSKKPKTPRKTLLQTTLEQLQSLKANLSDGKISATGALNQLTLILRAYFESRFHLPAEHQTTAEFIDMLRDKRDMLNRDQQYFIEDFLCATDKVKYANLPADKQTFLSAADSVEKFICAQESVPQEKQ